MTINLTRFYQLMEADYKRMMQIVEAGPYATHPDVLKIKLLNPATLFEKGKSLESISASIGFRNPGAVLTLKSNGEDVDRLTKLIEKTVITEITQPVLQKAMLRFLIKYVKHVNEDRVVPESEVIRIRFRTKKNEIEKKFIKMNEMLLQARDTEEIPGIIEALREDQKEIEVQEAEVKREADALEPENESENEAFEVVTHLKLSRCLQVFKGVEFQIDFFVYTWFFKETPGIWENENGVEFDVPASNKRPFSVKKVNNVILKNDLQVFATTLLNADPALKKIWEGEKLSLFQQLWSVTDNQKKCQKIAMALFFKNIYSILDNYKRDIKIAFERYQSADPFQAFAVKKITDIKSLLSAFSYLFIGGTSQTSDVEKAWGLQVQTCEYLFKDTNQKLMLANAGILDKLEEYGFDRTKPVTALDKSFLDLNQQIEDELNPTGEEEPQWGAYHPLYAENREAEKASSSPLPDGNKETRKATPS